jgi:hypothetical protein
MAHGHGSFVVFLAATDFPAYFIIPELTRKVVSSVYETRHCFS